MAVTQRQSVGLLSPVPSGQERTCGRELDAGGSAPRKNLRCAPPGGLANVKLAAFFGEWFAEASRMIGAKNWHWLPLAGRMRHVAAAALAAITLTGLFPAVAARRAPAK